ncbi:MAG: NAD-dependent epimerase/dehydratase family protein [Ectobacillus sp.]
MNIILVIGGAGKIGSKIVKELICQNHRVIVLDNLSTGQRENIDRKAVFERGDCTSPEDLDRVFSRYSIDEVIHVACDETAEPQNVNHISVLFQKMMEYSGCL